MFSVSGLGACISCFSHWCDKILLKSNFREEDFIWVTVRGWNLSWGGGGTAAGVGGGWSPGHVTLASEKQRGECCCSPGLHTWLAHLVCTPSFSTRFSPLFLSYQPGTQSTHSGWLFLPLVHPLRKRPHRYAVWVCLLHDHKSRQGDKDQTSQRLLEFWIAPLQWLLTLPTSFTPLVCCNLLGHPLWDWPRVTTVFINDSTQSLISQSLIQSLLILQLFHYLNFFLFFFLNWFY